MEEFKVYQTNAALGYKQLAYLLRLTGDNYLCIDVNCNTDIYKVGYVVEDLADFYVQDSDYKINDSPIFGSYLFDCLKVFTRTGLTPEQMEKEIKRLDALFQGAELKNEMNRDLEARLKEAVAVISKVNDWLYKGDESEYSNESLMDLTDEYLTKEKTK